MPLPITPSFYSPRPMQHVPHTSAYDLTFSTYDEKCTTAVTTWINGRWACCTDAIVLFTLALIRHTCSTPLFFPPPSAGNDAAALLEQLQAAAPQTAQLEAVDVAMGPIHNVPGLSFGGANQRTSKSELVRFICMDIHEHSLSLSFTTHDDAEAVGAIVEAAATSGLPTVLVTPATTTTTKNPVGRLALPSIRAGETGQVTLSGFSVQQPVALEITNHCVLGARDEAVSVESFTPPANSTPVRRACCFCVFV